MIISELSKKYGFKSNSISVYFNKQGIRISTVKKFSE